VTPRRARRSLGARDTVAMLAVIALVAVFVVRLVDVQVVQAARLDEQSALRRSVHVDLHGARGAIVDRNGVALADSVTRYDLTTAPPLVAPFTGRLGGSRPHHVSVDAALAAVARASGASVPAMRASVAANAHTDFAYLAKGLDTERYEAVMRLGIPWVYPQQQSARTYPTGAVAGNLTGFLGTDGAQAGLELAYDRCLVGADGSMTYERGADGVQLPSSAVTTKRAHDGGTLVTTIDSDLQYLAQQDVATAAQQLGAVSATATVTKAKTGEVLAVADYPTVDPNDVDATTDHGAFGSRALTDTYEPGSTIKAAIAAALIDRGRATPTTGVRVPDERRFPWGGRITDAERHPVEDLTLTGILQASSNVGITELGQSLTAQQRYDVMKDFGLFTPQPAITYGGQPRMDYPASPDWSAQTDVNSMFGQGISTTALQVAGIYQTLANGGVRVPLHVVKGCERPDGTMQDTPDVTGKRVVSPRAAHEVVQMLRSVIHGGTLNGMAPISGYDVAAKTGTAEVANGAAGYGADRIISVAGIAPADDPQYVVTVTFTKPGPGHRVSSAAAPAFRTLMSQVLEEYRVRPSAAEPPLYPSNW